MKRTNSGTGRRTARGHRVMLLAAMLLAVLAIPPGCRDARDALRAYTDAAHDAWGFEGAVLVAYKGRVLLNRGYGLADHTFGDPNTPSTKFYIGSITKQFTAAAILLLEERGLISVEDPITKYIPDYPAEPGNRIFIHHLLAHTSGIPNYTDIPEVLLRRMSRIAPSELIDLFKDLPLDFEPGARFEYSNSGYIILGAIIEAVSGQSYEAFLHKEILKPIGMDNSGYGRREMGIPQRAEGYTHTVDGAAESAPRVDLSVLHTAGALYSTVEDMLKWDEELYRHNVLDWQLVRKMLLPYTPGYAYGWFVESRFGRAHTWHGGFLDGYNTTFDRWPEDTLCIVVFSNEDDAPVRKIARGLAAIVFGESYTMPLRKSPINVNRDALAEYEGVYRIDSSLYRVVTLGDSALYTQIVGQPQEALLPEKTDTFFFEADNTVTAVFDRDSLGTVSAISITDDNLTAWAARLPPEEAAEVYSPVAPVTLDFASLDRLTGEYELESVFGETMTPFVLAVTRVGDHLRVSTVGSDSVDVFAASSTEFFHDVADYRIIFTLDQDGIVSGCILRMQGAVIHGRKVG